MTPLDKKRISEITQRLERATIDFQKRKSILKALDDQANFDFALCSKADMYFLLARIAEYEQREQAIGDVPQLLEDAKMYRNLFA